MFLTWVTVNFNLDTDWILANYLSLILRRAILDVRGQINFRIPNLEVGGYMKTKTNISTNLKATVNYDVKMRTFKTEVDTPEDIREVWTMTRNTYHYFKSENWHHKTNSGNQKLDVSEFHLTKSNKVSWYRLIPYVNVSTCSFTLRS